MIKKELSNYVERLFSNYKQNQEIQEMKEEILTNLEAKVEDYMEQGMSRDEAFDQAVKHIDSVDFMIDGNHRIYVNRYLTELIQTALIYSLLIWIITIPARIMFKGVLLNEALMFVSMMVGVIYLFMICRTNDETRDTVSIVNIKYVFKWKRKIWLIWLMFIIAILVTIIALRFGSDLWFWRPVHISGPYQLAELLYSFSYPFISIAIPLLFNKACSILGKYEVNS
ncbi:permease prefix domain 1-containing protein [Aneurinibacillus aneurinilyticus]|uniref:permease prefix domain 1-containing protein n=1 Tax=Aneurinibacillus aneurinilyticus TaxID=1391 RepID=UPI00352681F6